jgi:hypothetical protein
MLFKKSYGSWDNEKINNYWLDNKITDCSKIIINKNINFLSKNDDKNYINKRNDKLNKINYVLR